MHSRQTIQHYHHSDFLVSPTGECSLDTAAEPSDPLRATREEEQPTRQMDQRIAAAGMPLGSWLSQLSMIHHDQKSKREHQHWMMEKPPQQKSISKHPETIQTTENREEFARIKDQGQPATITPLLGVGKRTSKSQGMKGIFNCFTGVDSSGTTLYSRSFMKHAAGLDGAKVRSHIDIISGCH
ncbi:predicted protein [Histoplasma capsulatum H143]|uniref:Uncharacterized protein n=1 Tax=Ajellomyces capsulatus (strain H143) TaxID=544712 RepID=C6HSG1_AJECH|nr:predicted protein [Histoplasma capsulatum H143]